GIEKNAAQIAAGIVALSSVVKLHLTIEDRILYPALQYDKSRKLAEMGWAYQEDMKGIANAYIAFSRRSSPEAVVAEMLERFRAEANMVLKSLHARTQKENVEFYPAIEAL